MQEASRQQYLKAMGVDVWVRRVLPLGEEAIEVPESPSEEGPQAVIIPVEEPVENRVIFAQNASELTQWLNTRCLMPVRVGAKQVTSIGSIDASLLVLSECAVKDQTTHQPFSGRAAFLLKAMLKAIGESFETVLQAELDTPLGDATTLTSLLHERPIKAVLLLVDLPATQTASFLQNFREEIYHYGDAETRIFVSFHPDYLITHPETKALAWEDLKQVRDYLANVSAG